MDGVRGRRFVPISTLQALAFALVMLLMVGGLGGLIFYISDRTTPDSPRAVSGSIDIRDWDFSSSGPIPLSGEWAFAPGTFNLDAPKGPSGLTALARVHVPGDWRAKTGSSSAAMASPYGYGLYVIDIDRSEGQDGLALLVPDEAIAWQLWIGGELKAQSGVPAQKASLALVHRRSVLVPLPDTRPSSSFTGTERTEVEILVSNYSYDVGGLINPVVLGLSKHLAARLEAISILDGIVLGCLFAIGLYHFFLFILGIDDRASLYFGVFCFFLLVRSIVIAHYPERIFEEGPLGALAFGLSARIEYLCFFLGMPTYLAFVVRLFPEESDRRVLLAAGILGIAASAFVLLTPVPLFMAWTTKPFQAATILACAYALLVFGRAAAKGRLGAWYGLVGFAAFFLIILNDIFHADMLIRTAHLAPLGLLLFMNADSCIISSRVAATFASERRLSRELAEEKQLLDRRIADRTAELSASNERLRDVDKAKSRFLATISHELRTPLTLLVSPLEQAARGAYGPSIPADGELMSRLLRNGYRVLNLVEGMFDFARLELGKLEPRPRYVGLASALSFYAAEVDSLAAKKGVTLSVSDELDTPCEVDVDPRLFEIAFFNVLSNAFKFTPPGGSVKIVASGPLPDGRVSIAVSDTGIGIKSELLPRIFNKLDWQADPSDRLYDGAGIGLSLCKKIVMLHGGEIRAESEEGSGSTFTILLPARRLESGTASASVSEMGDRARSILGEAVKGLREASPKAKPEVAEAARPSTQPFGATPARAPAGAPVLLLVEDSLELLEFTSERLVERFEVRAARDGKEALSLLSLSPVPDLVVSDIMMPRMDGNELFMEAKARLGELCPPFIFLTARSEAEERREALADGVIDYLRKPFDMDELVLKVESLLSLRAKARETGKREVKEALARFLEAEGGAATVVGEGGKAESVRRKREEALSRLAPREAEVALLAARGFPIKEIGQRLGIADRTVSNTLVRVYEKLGIEGKLALVRLLEGRESE